MKKKFVRFALPIPFVILAIAAMLIHNQLVRGILIGVSLGPLVILGLLSAFGIFMRRKLGTALKPPPMPTKSWDYAISLTDLDGNAISPESWRGKVLVVNYWATWCGPCAVEMPNLMRLVEKTKDSGVQYAFITREDAATVQPFVTKKGWSLPFMLQAGETPACFVGHGIPATFIIDRSGTIVMRHFGAAAWDAEPVVSFIRGLAATPA